MVAEEKETKVIKDIVKKVVDAGNVSALQLLKEQRPKSLVFVKDEDLQTQDMFYPMVTVLESQVTDFHNISGQFVPKKYQADRIADAAGIEFLPNCGVRTEQHEGHTVYIGFAQGRKRWPDGSWRKSSVCEYELDPIKRAEEDILKDTKGKYTGPQGDKEKKLLELTYQKFARARANTGARLRVIRELTGMPTGFKEAEIKKAMVFARVSLNSNKLLDDPQFRETAIKIGLGAAEDMYDNRQTQVIDDSHLIQYEEPTEEDETPFPGPEQSKEDEEIEAGIERLKVYADIPYLHKDAKAMAISLIAEAEPTLDTINSMIERIEYWLVDPKVIAKHGEYRGLTK
jgi:hypothetical protein